VSAHARLIHLACPDGGRCKGHDTTPEAERAAQEPQKTPAGPAKRRGRAHAYACAAERLNERGTAYDTAVGRMLNAAGDVLENREDRVKAIGALIKAADAVGIAVLAPNHPANGTPATST
jgi:hypothetical protein